LVIWDMTEGRTLFESTAAYYARFRPPYPEQAFDALIDRFRLNAESHVLDLGCGTGQIAIPLACRMIPIHAVDPDIEMLSEGQCAEERAGICRICWYRGDDTVVDQLFLPPLAACIMGASFHWMDREGVLRKLDRMIVSGGGVAVLSGSGSVWSDSGEDWVAVAKKVITEFLGPERRAGSGIYTRPPERHEILLRRSAFSNVEDLTFEQEQVVSVDDIIGLQLSTSYASPAQLGEHIEDFTKMLRRRLLEVNPFATFRGSVKTQVLIATR
jgi:SAM-dependent methyltransferase